MKRIFKWFLGLFGSGITVNNVKNSKISIEGKNSGKIENVTNSNINIKTR